MRPAADNGQRAACNRQRASDSRRHARGREHMRDATGNTRHCRISCAASSGKQTSSMREALSSTTSAKNGTDDTHKMQHTTSAAARTKHKRNRQHAAGNAMYEMRRTKSGRSRTSGHAAPAVVESDGVLDSDCRRVTSQSSRATRKTGHSDGGTDSAKSDVPNSQVQSGMHGERD
jgi:hypothetical protein